MSTPERFEISVDGSRVTARIDRPAVDAGAAVPTVLLCSMLPIETHAEAAEDLRVGSSNMKMIMLRSRRRLQKRMRAAMFGVEPRRLRKTA